MEQRHGVGGGESSVFSEMEKRWGMWWYCHSQLEFAYKVQTLLLVNIEDTRFGGGFQECKRRVRTACELQSLEPREIEKAATREQSQNQEPTPNPKKPLSNEAMLRGNNNNNTEINKAKHVGAEENFKRQNLEGVPKQLHVCSVGAGRERLGRAQNTQVCEGKNDQWLPKRFWSLERSLGV